jgi:uncharacterized delta-60 repeat protein
LPHSPTTRTRLSATALLAALALAGCGSDGGGRPTGGQAATGTGGDRPSFGTVQPAALSAEHDRLLSAAFDGANRLYAAGWVATGDDQAMAVSRFGLDGGLDQTFGDKGVATANVAVGGKAVELARSVVVQASGKIVVAGPVEHDPSATGDAAKDTDVALVRFDQDGRLDPSFGSGGIVRLDLSTGVAEGTAYRADTSWGLIEVAGDKLLLVAGQVAPGRTDLDFAVVRLTADGATDPSFGAGGVSLVGAAPGASDVPKTAVELPDGRVVVTGYASVAGTVQTVLFRLATDGALDPTFGTDGVSVQALLGNVTEAYAVGVLGNGRLVTTGYGKDSADAKVDLIIGGFTPDGAVDRAHGDNGVVRIDLAGDDDRGRSLVGLPGGGALVVGSGKATASNLDGLVVRIDGSGALDEAFGTSGRRLYDLGGPNDSFFGVAVSPDRSRVAVVGYVGQATNGSGKDDGAVLWLEP